MDNELVIFNNTVEILPQLIFLGQIVWQLPTQSSQIVNETYGLKISKLVSDGKNIFFSNTKNEFFSIDKKMVQLIGLIKLDQILHQFIK